MLNISPSAVSASRSRHHSRGSGGRESGDRRSLSGMRLRARHVTADAFVARIVRIIARRIIVAWVAGRARSDPLFQLFDLEFDFFAFFHVVTSFLVDDSSSIACY